MKRILLPLAVALALPAMGHSQPAQFGPSSLESIRGASPPSLPRHRNKTWVRTTDNMAFSAEGDSVWLANQPIVFSFGRNAASATDLRPPGAVTLDATAGQELGYYAFGNLRLVRVAGASSSASAPTGKIHILADQDTIWTQNWDAVAKLWDGITGATADSTDVIGAYLESVGGVPVEPAYPVVSTYWIEVVAP